MLFLAGEGERLEKIATEGWDPLANARTLILTSTVNASEKFAGSLATHVLAVLVCRNLLKKLYRGVYNVSDTSDLVPVYLLEYDN